MKKFLLLFLVITTVTAFGQTTPPAKNGNYFETNSNNYFEKVIKPWRYQFTATDNLKETEKKIGEITFWRSEALYDSVSQLYWKPNISYDIYASEHLNYVNSLAEKIKLNSTCNFINTGGDVLPVGDFILFTSSACVNCASVSNMDYCRNIISRIFNLVPNKNTNDFKKIIRQFIIKKGNFLN